MTRVKRERKKRKNKKNKRKLMKIENNKYKTKQYLEEGRPYKRCGLSKVSFSVASLIAI